MLPILPFVHLDQLWLICRWFSGYIAYHRLMLRWQVSARTCIPSAERHRKRWYRLVAVPNNCMLSLELIHELCSSAYNCRKGRKKKVDMENIHSSKVIMLVLFISFFPTCLSCYCLLLNVVNFIFSAKLLNK